jgi:signal peptidase I
MGLQFRIWALAAALALLAKAEGPIYVVRTSAMEPTFLAGDRVLAPGGEPITQLQRGDVIAFHFPPDPKVVLIKRLIGMPGDRIQIINGALLVNARTISEPYVQHASGRSASPFFSNFPSYADKEVSLTPSGRDMQQRYVKAGELVVPDGAYFVLGDNRDYSYDSRSWGPVNASQIIGLVHEILSSADPKTQAARADRIHLPVKRGNLN